MTMEFTEIVATMSGRLQLMSPLQHHMIEVQRRYDGEWILPSPNQDDEPTYEAMGPALVADTIEHLALRCSSLSWTINVPALNPADEDGRGSIAWATKRRKAMHATYFRSQAPLAIRTAYKHFTGYATCAMGWIWDDDPKSRTYQMPKLVVRDPLGSFPEPKPPYDMSLPRNIGFVAAHSTENIIARWASRHPEVVAMLRAGRNGVAQMWDLVEWIDEDDVVIGILGPHYQDTTRRQDWMTNGGYAPAAWNNGRNLELARYPNKCEYGCVPFVAPTQVTMSKVASAVAKNVGQADLMNKIIALDIAASERDVFPDRYIIGHGSQQPSLVGHKRWQDGRSGNTNIIQYADAVSTLHNTPSQAARQLSDRVERNFKTSTGLTPEWGGETYGSLRTGRGIDSMIGASTDPRVAELQETMEMALTELNRGMISMYKGYAEPGKKYVLFSGFSGDRGHVEFIPATHFESDEQVVEYPVLGMSAQDLTIELGQLYGSKAISLRTMRYLHPHIKDPEGEEHRVWFEMVAMAAIDSMAAAVQQGTMPAEDLAQIAHLVQTQGIVAAILKASELAQQRQAEQAQMPQPGQLGPGGGQLALPPGTQPGLGPPGAGMEQQPPPEASPQIGPPPVSLDNLRMMTRDLKIRA